MIEANAAFLSADRFDAMSDDDKSDVERHKSYELHSLTSEFINQGWHCHWTTLTDVDVTALRHNRVYDVRTGESRSIDNNELNSTIDVVLARILGSVEGNIKAVRAYFEQLQARYTGITINDPASVLYGLRKDYLFKFADAGFESIPTEYFDNTVTYKLLAERYGGEMFRHVIKPVTGELSNSIALLSDVDETVLRRKEHLVGGWLVQPVMDEIWNGEYQLFYVGDSLTHANRKMFARKADSPLPDQAGRKVTQYEPDAKEERFAFDLKRFWTEKLGLRTDIFRVDFMKRDDGTPILLEFETVNPGLFIHYMKPSARSNVAKEYETYVSKRLANRS